MHKTISLYQPICHPEFISGSQKIVKLYEKTRHPEFISADFHSAEVKVTLMGKFYREETERSVVRQCESLAEAHKNLRF